MKETLTDIRNRRSCRKYLPQQIAEEELATVLEAATWTPTGRGLQTPQLVVVQDSATLRQLSVLNGSFMGWGPDKDPMYAAPTAVLVFSDPTVPTGRDDSALMMGTLMLAAHAVGLGSCWINRGRQMFDTPEGRELMKKWGVDDKYEGHAICILGYPDEGGIHDPKPRREDYIIRA